MRLGLSRWFRFVLSLVRVRGWYWAARLAAVSVYLIVGSRSVLFSDVPRPRRFRFTLSLVRVRCWFFKFSCMAEVSRHYVRVRNVGSRFVLGSPGTSIFKIAPRRLIRKRAWAGGGVRKTFGGRNCTHTAHTGFPHVNPVRAVRKKLRPTLNRHWVTVEWCVSGAPRRRRRRRRNISQKMPKRRNCACGDEFLGGRTNRGNFQGNLIIPKI